MCLFIRYAFILHFYIRNLLPDATLFSLLSFYGTNNIIRIGILFVFKKKKKKNVHVNILKIASCYDYNMSLLGIVNKCIIIK